LRAVGFRAEGMGRAIRAEGMGRAIRAEGMGRAIRVGAGSEPARTPGAGIAHGVAAGGR